MAKKIRKSRGIRDNSHVRTNPNISALGLLETVKNSFRTFDQLFGSSRSRTVGPEAFKSIISYVKHV